MNNLKETILKRMLIRLFLILLQNIRNFFMQFRLYLFRRRVLAGVLCVCLVTLSMPFPVLAAENSVDVQENMHDEINEVVSFTEQPDEVKEQPSEEGKEETSEKDTGEGNEKNQEEDTNKRNESELENSDNQNGDEYVDSGNEGEKDEKEPGDSDYEDAEKPENSDKDNGETSEDSTDEENVENFDEAYTLAEDVELTEISVTETEVMLAKEDLPDVSGSTTPMCGIIRNDTIWEAGELSDGELIIEPGVTLTINGQVYIIGTVTIKGGGTIRRGNGNANIWTNGDVTIGDITIDGAETLDWTGYEILFRGSTKG